MENIKNPSFWDEAWQRSIREREARKSGNGLERWNKRASEFASRSAGGQAEPRVQKVLDWLQRMEVELANASILDIGAGTGAFALPFAESAREIVALEPAGKLAQVLRTRAEEAGCRNLKLIQEEWETLDVDALGWQGRFDLVFASQCPGINNRETLEKAIRCARRYCFVSSFAGKRENSAVRDLWPRLTGQEQPPFTLDIQPAQNLLHVLGYTYDSRIFEEKRTIHLDAAAALPHIRDGLNAYNLPEHAHANAEAAI